MSHASRLACLALLAAVLACAKSDSSDLIQPDRWWEVQPRPGYASLERVGVFQEWFEVWKLPDGTLAIYEPYQFEEVISYLVPGLARAALVDTGTGIGDMEALVFELTDLPVEVISTHAHYDHVGDHHQFDEIGIFDHPEPIARLKRGVPNEKLRKYVRGDYVYKRLPEGFDARTWTIPPVEPTYLMQDGDIIDLGGRRLEVIHTPGHSPGSVCLLDRQNALLITGDHFFPGPLYAHEKDVDLADYVASNRRLASMVDLYDHVLPGHNEPWVESDVIPRVSRAFEAIFAGKGRYDQDGEIRRYYFDGFDILLTTAEADRGPRRPKD